MVERKVAKVLVGFSLLELRLLTRLSLVNAKIKVLSSQTLVHSKIICDNGLNVEFKTTGDPTDAFCTLELSHCA